jgi:formylmethanofuran dehydrogenase subunit C
MQIVKLSLKKPNKIPIEADEVKPDNFAGKTEGEIKAILVWYGNGQCPLGEFFNVSVEGKDSAENTKIFVTIQPTKTCPLMLILMKTLKTINNL